MFYTAALPAYRRAWLEIVSRALGNQWQALAGESLLDQTVVTGVPRELYTAVRNCRLVRGRILLQLGHWRVAIAAFTTVIDLNPRSLTAWGILLTRRLLGRRTLVWGHLYPRKGPSSKTAVVREAMRRMADGSLVYSYDDHRRAAELDRSRRVWVVPNALYSEHEIRVTLGRRRDAVLYVGRLESPKKPRLLLDAFAVVARSNRVLKLVMVGDGSLRAELEAAAATYDLGSRVTFCGSMHDVQGLAALYASAWCSVSPGYVGLSLTQSLGFGVPMVIAANEPHAPEVELAAEDATVFFEQGSVDSLAAALQSAALGRTDSERVELAARVRQRYSAEVMARGFLDALQDMYTNRAEPQGDSAAGTAGPPLGAAQLETPTHPASSGVCA